MMVDYSNKVVCSVCGGKGGFSKSKNHALDSNWNDCLYCEGYGFTDETSTDSECREFLQYVKHRNSILGELANLGEVSIISTENIGKDLYVKIVPIVRNRWVELVKTMLKFAHYSETISITPKQSFYYTELGKHHTYWELHIDMHSFKDLEGLTDLLKMYNNMKV